MSRIKTHVIALVVALAALSGLAGVALQPGIASADGVAAVTCAFNPTGLNDCTITLGTYIAPGGSVVGTLNAAGSIVSCNTIPAGGFCSVSPTSVTFACPAGCGAGSAFHDVVQYSNAPSAQFFTATGSSCLVGVYGAAQTCGYAAGNPCYGVLGYSVANACGSLALVNGCLSSGTVALANVCTSGYLPGSACTSVTLGGALVNRCGLGLNCVGTVYTALGPVERSIC
jgi:hypothetical protein